MRCVTARDILMDWTRSSAGAVLENSGGGSGSGSGAAEEDGSGVKSADNVKRNKAILKQ